MAHDERLAWYELVRMEISCIKAAIVIIDKKKKKRKKQGEMKSF